MAIAYTLNVVGANPISVSILRPWTNVLFKLLHSTHVLMGSCKTAIMPVVVNIGYYIDDNWQQNEL